MLRLSAQGAQHNRPILSVYVFIWPGPEKGPTQILWRVAFRWRFHRRGGRAQLRRGEATRSNSLAVPSAGRARACRRRSSGWHDPPYWLESAPECRTHLLLSHRPVRLLPFRTSRAAPSVSPSRPPLFPFTPGAPPRHLLPPVTSFAFRVSRAGPPSPSASVPREPPLRPSFVFLLCGSPPSSSPAAPLHLPSPPYRTLFPCVPPPRPSSISTPAALPSFLPLERRNIVNAKFYCIHIQT
jgi:hypothetical protein